MADGRHLAVLRSIMGHWRDGDLDAVVAHLHDDIVWHYAAGAMPPVRGRDKARRLLEVLQHQMLDVRWQAFASAEVGDRLFVEGVDAYRTPDGHEVATPYAGVLELRDGLVIGWRDYVDLGVAARHRSGEPFADHLTELLARPEI
ncbi:MAG: nuclear transport factor 2 family protein [Acidimicrobiales bacterium]|nr:nuclear transport factor 2 family protein [Acidimicrobiales bacterium]